MLTTEQRIMKRVSKSDPDGCWLWTGGKNSWGYGYINIGGSMKRVHKVMWELSHPTVQVGLHLDHLCRERACCNPDHLEVVTHAENLRRGKRSTNGNENKTHCPQGHAYTPENTYVYESGRVCKKCRHIASTSPEKRAYDRARYAPRQRKEKSSVI